MAKKSRTKSQKKYKMVGCNKSKNSKKNRTKNSRKNSKKTSKKYLGGRLDALTPANYQTGKPFSNDAKAYTAEGPKPGGFNFLNPQTSSYKGKGGGCGGKNPLPAANGLLGNAWTPSVGSWPGVDGNPNNGNHLGYNKYDNDISRQMKDVGAAYPYTYMNGGKRRSNTKNTLRNIKKMSKNVRKNKSKKNRHSRKNKNKHGKKKGGGINNYLIQDFVNLGRNVKYNMGSTWNALNGYTAPVNPNPWEDQYEHAQLKNHDKTFY
tara:strand:+ start:1591 stop:2379 length:789 start_codon:yes stop_codon:yes gene_type:complete